MLVSGSIGCAGPSGAHQLGFIPNTAVIADVGDNLLHDPKDPNLFTTSDDQSLKDPLVRIGYWRPGYIAYPHWTRPIDWDRFLVDIESTEDLGEAFMIIDISPLHQNMSLGAGSRSEVFQRRLAGIAELLLVAADHNGEIYWRLLVANLETLDLAESASDILIGGGIPSAFISPALGATLTGLGLLIDMFEESYIDGLDVNDYAALRESASLYRNALRLKIYKEIDSARPGQYAVQAVLALANDYAFTYSIKGSLYAVQKQNEQLRTQLEGGTPTWNKLFLDDRNKKESNQISSGSETGTTTEEQAGTGNGAGSGDGGGGESGNAGDAPAPVEGPGQTPAGNNPV